MEVVGKLRGHGNSILCLAVVSDLVCSGSADRTVRVWRGFDRNYSCLAVLEGHRGCNRWILTRQVGHLLYTWQHHFLYTWQLLVV
jgi:WD40 repeat protein